MKITNAIVGIALCFVGVWAYGDNNVSRAEISLQRNDRLIYSNARRESQKSIADSADTFEQARILLWQEAYAKYPELLELRNTIQWSTPIGLMFKMLDDSKNILEYKERLAQIIIILKTEKIITEEK